MLAHTHSHLPEEKFVPLAQSINVQACFGDGHAPPHMLPKLVFIIEQFGFGSGAIATSSPQAMLEKQKPTKTKIASAKGRKNITNFSFFGANALYAIQENDYKTS
jgi:hypothetical protein